MTAEQIAKKYVHGLHDALTDRQEIKDMIADIETYAERYHQAKLKELGIANVLGQRKQLQGFFEFYKQKFGGGFNTEVLEITLKQYQETL